MSNKVYTESHWYYDWARNGFSFVQTGFYSENEPIEPIKFISMREARLLAKVLDEAGIIKPRMDDKVRREDVHMMNRLIDIIELRLSQGGKNG